MRVPSPSLLESSAVKIGVRYRSDWCLRHYAACSDPEPLVELPLALLIEGAMRYFQNNPELTKDRYLYPHFCEMLSGMRGLLSGSVGRFDQGVIDGLLYDMSEEATAEEPHGAREPLDPRE